MREYCWDQCTTRPIVRYERYSYAQTTRNIFTEQPKHTEGACTMHDVRNIDCCMGGSHPRRAYWGWRRLAAKHFRRYLSFHYYLCDQLWRMLSFVCLRQMAAATAAVHTHCATIDSWKKTWIEIRGNSGRAVNVVERELQKLRGKPSNWTRQTYPHFYYIHIYGGCCFCRSSNCESIRIRRHSSKLIPLDCANVSSNISIKNQRWNQ